MMVIPFVEVTASVDEYAKIQKQAVPVLQQSLSLASRTIATCPSVQQTITEW